MRSADPQASGVGGAGCEAESGAEHYVATRPPGEVGHVDEGLHERH